jgi:hypothetical protein
VPGRYFDPPGGLDGFEHAVVAGHQQQGARAGRERRLWLLARWQVGMGNDAKRRAAPGSSARP